MVKRITASIKRKLKRKFCSSCPMRRAKGRAGVRDLDLVIRRGLESKIQIRSIRLVDSRNLEGKKVIIESQLITNKFT